MFKEIIKNKLVLINIILLVCLVNFSLLAGDIKGKVHLKGAKSSSGVFVYIENVKGSFSPPKDEIIMDQRDLQFFPDVLPILVGSTVTFLNNDNVLHNVFTPDSCSGPFNLGTWPTGQSKTHTFKKADCFISILCNVHPDMQAWIVVLQNPYFIQSDSAGNYEIKNLPEGEYNLKVWYPFYETQSERIIVKGLDIIRKDFTLYN